MYLLLAAKDKPNPTQKEQTLVATFDTEEQLRAYVQWATLRKKSEGRSDFEQGSALAGYSRWFTEQDQSGIQQEISEDVIHNPSPNML